MPSGLPEILGVVVLAVTVKTMANVGMLARVMSGATDAVSITLSGDDVPDVIVSFEQAAYLVDEGTTTIATTLDASPKHTLAIPVASNEHGGATTADYLSVPDSLTFGSGDAEQSTTFTAAQDSVDDDGGSVKHTFGTLLEAVIPEKQ